MIDYIIRRIGYGVLILIGVNLFTFLLFFSVNTPDDMARMSIGGKRVSDDAIVKWKVARGYDKPLVWNASASGVEKLTDTIFVARSLPLFALDFGSRAHAGVACLLRLGSSRATSPRDAVGRCRNPRAVAAAPWGAVHAAS